MVEVLTHGMAGLVNSSGSNYLIFYYGTNKRIGGMEGVRMREIIRQVSEMLESNEVYLVGGSVRDILLGKTPKDYDFCTSLDPDTIEERVKKAGRKAYLVGKRFGTVGCKFETNGEWQIIEITTFRNETYTYGSRKPAVTFSTNIHEDLSRRDFTINAMAMKSSGKLIDPFNGQQDLKDGIIRCVDSPKRRFREDPLRILRAVRFASRFGYVIEPYTFSYAQKMRYELYNVSRERWVTELDKILVSEYSDKGLLYLELLNLLDVIFPELSIQVGYDQNNPHHSYTLWEHTKRVVQAIPNDDLELKWVGLLHDIGKPFTRSLHKKGHSNYISHELVGAEMSLKISSYLKFSNERRDYLYEMIKNHLNDDSPLKPYDDASK
jgi:tRNA nucleotidyltransferase (CCA-adding enzyme)